MGSRQQLSKVQLGSVTVQDSEISVRNLGACLTGFMWANSAVRPCAIYIPSERSENIYRKMLPKSSFTPCNIPSWLLQLPALWFPKYQRDPLQRILSSCSCPHCLLAPKFTHHTPAFIIYIGYQCPSASSATRPLISPWFWPCLPKEVSKIQGKWSLQFKI